MKIVLEEGNISTFGLRAENGRTILVQSDWDFPGVAWAFGWSPCPCGATDGTIDCDHRSVSEMIASAHDFLRAHAGEATDDPGYF